MAAIWLGNAGVFLLSALMILAGGGDLTIVLKLLFHRGGTKETVYLHMRRMYGK